MGDSYWLSCLQINEIGRLMEIIRQAAQEQALVFYTLADPHMAEAAEKACEVGTKCKNVTKILQFFLTIAELLQFFVLKEDSIDRPWCADAPCATHQHPGTNHRRNTISSGSVSLRHPERSTGAEDRPLEAVLQTH